MNKKCETCIKRKTLFCPTSIKCMANDDKLYYQDKIMLLEENKILKENAEHNDKVVDKVNWENMLLKKENKELKRQNSNFKTSLDEGQEVILDYIEENKKLKKQVEEWKHHLECSKEMLDIQGQKGSYDFDEYMLGLYNGMEYIISLFETREPKYIDSKDVKFTDSKTTKFIKYLENLMGWDSVIVGEILQKYKEIIGESDDKVD